MGCRGFLCLGPVCRGDSSSVVTESSSRVEAGGEEAGVESFVKPPENCLAENWGTRALWILLRLRGLSNIIFLVPLPQL